MAFEEAARLVSGAVHYIDRLGTLCITIGLFLFVVVIFKGSPDFGVVPFRLIFLGFGLIFWENSIWKELNRFYAVALLTASLVPTRFYVTAYAYLK
jgi:hypothetical protein